MLVNVELLGSAGWCFDLVGKDADEITDDSSVPGPATQDAFRARDEYLYDFALLENQSVSVLKLYNWKAEFRCQAIREQCL